MNRGGGGGGGGLFYRVSRVRSGIMSIVLFPANILLHMHPIYPT